MNVLAMIGYAAYPLMPPRLLNDCATAFGGCVPGFHFVDTMDVYGGLWSWRSSTVEKVSNVDGEYCHSNAVSFILCGLVSMLSRALDVRGRMLHRWALLRVLEADLTGSHCRCVQISNHYAAMPSMHFGYSCWVAAIVTQLLLAATQPSTAQKVCFAVHVYTVSCRTHA